MNDQERFKIVEGLSLALGKIHLLNSYAYKLAELIDQDNPDIVIGDIERMIGQDIEIEEMAIRLRFRDISAEKVYEKDTKDSCR